MLGASDARGPIRPTRDTALPASTGENHANVGASRFTRQTAPRRDASPTRLDLRQATIPRSRQTRPPGMIRLYADDDLPVSMPLAEQALIGHSVVPGGLLTGNCRATYAMSRP
jgi:hypothetical protein